MFSILLLHTWYIDEHRCILKYILYTKLLINLKTNICFNFLSLHLMYYWLVLIYHRSYLWFHNEKSSIGKYFQMKWKLQVYYYIIWFNYFDQRKRYAFKRSNFSDIKYTYLGFVEIKVIDKISIISFEVHELLNYSLNLNDKFKYNQ